MMTVDKIADITMDIIVDALNYQANKIWFDIIGCSFKLTEIYK